jgi:hypothetical protein
VGLPRRILEVNELLPILMTTGLKKNSLPFRLRDWVNILGLYIQLRSAGGWERLEAGGKHRSYFDALNRDINDAGAFLGEADKWEIRKFDREVWDSRFAHLVLPTLDIAFFVSRGYNAGDLFNEQAAVILTEVAKCFQTTGDWPSLPSGRFCDKCKQELTIEQHRNKFCLYCGNKLN